MKQMQIVIVPSPSATAGQLRDLGGAIGRWTDLGAGPRYQLTAMNLGLRDLLAGELPLPLALEATRQRRRLTGESVRRLAAHGLTPEDAWRAPEHVRGHLESEAPLPPPGELDRQRERFGDLANLRCVCLSADGPGFTRAEIVVAMQEFIGDSGAIGQVFVDGTDWSVR